MQQAWLKFDWHFPVYQEPVLVNSKEISVLYVLSKIWLPSDLMISDHSLRYNVLKSI